MARRSKGEEPVEDDVAPKARWKGLPLQDREDVVLSVSPSRAANFYKYIYTLGLYELWRRRDTAVVTDKRLLISRGIFNRVEHSISMAQIETARFSRRGANAYALVTVTERGGRHTERVGPMSAKSARHFVAAILERT